MHRLYPKSPDIIHGHGNFEHRLSAKKFGHNPWAWIILASTLSKNNSDIIYGPRFFWHRFCPKTISTLSMGLDIGSAYFARWLFPSNIPMSYGRKLLPRTMSVDYVKIKAHGLWQWILIVDDGRHFVQCRVDPQPCTKLFPWNMSICNDHEPSPWTMSLNFVDGPWP